MDTENLKKIFGERVKRLRERAGLTQQSVAVAAGLSIGGYCKLERGEVDASWSSVVRLAHALGAEVGEFMPGRAKARAS